LYPQLLVIWLTDLLGPPIIFVLIFVHWKKGSQSYLKYSHKLFFGLLVFLFLVMPSINLCVEFVAIFDPDVFLTD
jgi:hypothetical protein